MPERRQKVRHTESAANLYVGLIGQLTVDITNFEVRVHDGSTAGGIRQARRDLANADVATSGNDGKMSSTQAANLAQALVDIDAVEATVAALDATDIAFDDDGLLVTAADVQAALEANDAYLVANLVPHIADTTNPHEVTAAQAGALAIAENLNDLDDAPTAIGNLGLTPEADAAYTAGTSTDVQATSPAKVRKSIQSFLNWPAGVEFIYADTTPPAGTLALNGQAVSRSTHSALFALYGTVHGVGDGSTTFNLPNYQNRMPVGSGDTYTDGETGGAATVTLTAAQSGLPSHRHTFRGNTAGGDPGTYPTLNGDGGGPANNVTFTSNALDNTGGTAASQAHENMPPFIGRPWFVTTGGV